MLERKTIISTKVIEVLKNTNHPITMSYILDRLNEKELEPNKSTIYRILKKLIEKKAVREVLVRDDGKYYELAEKNHHHFICQLCKKVMCLDIEDLNLPAPEPKDLVSNNKYHIQSFEFNLYGVCEPCTT